MRISRIVLSTISLLAGALSLRAQTSVWKVTSGSNVIYLGGTCHILRAQDFPLPAEYDMAFNASQSLYFETDLGKATDPSFQQKIMTSAVYADGGTLEKVLSPEAWKAVQDYCAKAGLPLAAISKFRPGLFTTIIASMELQKIGVTEEGVDLYYYKQAGLQKKAVNGLETIEQQIGFLVNMGAGHESEMVLSSIQELADLPKEFADIMAAWRSGNLAKIDETMLKEMREKYTSAYDELIVKRNRAWLPTIEGLLKTAPTEFVVVGAAHLAGTDGLIAELTKRGYKVEQVVAKK